MQAPTGLGTVEGLQEVPARYGSELRENRFSRIEFLRQRMQPGLPRPDGSADEIRRHILDDERANQVGSRSGQAPGVQSAHGVADQNGGPPKGVDGRYEFGDEPFCADGGRIVDISAAMPGRVIGVDRAKQGQPWQLTRPGAAATHQPVDKYQWPAGTAAVGQLGTHTPILARPDLGPPRPSGGRGSLGAMTVVKINAIEVPPGAGPELEKRFSNRAHAVDGQPGFLGFQLLRPVKGDDRYFVVTQWESEEAFQTWAAGPAIAAHAGERANPVSTGSSLLEFEVVLDVARSSAQG